MSTAPSKKMYVGVWVALLALLGLTFGLAEVNLGPFNNVAALCISIAKMLLVVLIFMHGKYEKPLTWIFIVGGVVWFLIMVDLTLSDFLTRGNVRPTSQSWRHVEQNPPTIEPRATQD